MLPLSYGRALANRRFRLVTVGLGVSSLGDGMSALGVAWLAIEISTPANRGLVIGGAVAACTLPGGIGILLRRVLGHILNPLRVAWLSDSAAAQSADGLFAPHSPASDLAARRAASGFWSRPRANSSSSRT